MTPRQKSFAVPAGVVAAVVAAGACSIWFGTGRVVWTVRFVAFGIVVAVTLFLRALSRPRGRVLKHTPCSQCARQILFEHEAEVCAQCEAGLHATCLDEHRSKAHAAGPFR